MTKLDTPQAVSGWLDATAQLCAAAGNDKDAMLLHEASLFVVIQHADLVSLQMRTFDVLGALLARYRALVNSGDCGFCDCDDELEVVNADVLLKEVSGNPTQAPLEKETP